jgi:hypothetical protein
VVYLLLGGVHVLGHSLGAVIESPDAILSGLRGYLMAQALGSMHAQVTVAQFTVEGFGPRLE